MPVAVLVAMAIIREVRIAWNVPEYEAGADYFKGSWYCYQCGTVANADGIRRTFTIVAEGKRAQMTLLPHGKVLWNCEHGCTIELDETRVTPKDRVENDLRIEHGVLKVVAP
jgi:hypothetical protein